MFQIRKKGETGKSKNYGLFMNFELIVNYELRK